MHTSKHVGRCCLQHLCHWPRRFHAILNLSYVFSGSDRAKLLWVWYLKTKLSSISTFNTNFFSNRIFKLSSSYYFNPARIELSGLSWAKSHGERKTSVFISFPIPQAAAPGPRSNRIDVLASLDYKLSVAERFNFFFLSNFQIINDNQWQSMKITDN